MLLNQLLSPLDQGCSGQAQGKYKPSTNLTVQKLRPVLQTNAAVDGNGERKKQHARKKMFLEMTLVGSSCFVGIIRRLALRGSIESLLTPRGKELGSGAFSYTHYSYTTATEWVG